MKIAVKIISSLISFVLVLLLIISLYIMVSSRITGSQPSVMGNQLMLVLSGSMEPNIKTGSVVGVKPLDDKEKLTLKKGDIITFYSPIKANTIVTHRIKEIKGQGNQIEYITQGDNNKTEDPIAVPAQSLIGKYANIHVPYAGYILGFLQSKKGIALSLILPGLILIIYNSISLWKIFKQWDPSKKVASSTNN
ncbi:signal peptidase I [Bacillus sp. ISL-39]|uniref:signal peptidase I n=1 Tax=Bacillus sp. ISL-39 TaxID=2819124 RepID=UPI001BEBA9E7|nr:signal peptidase I [Bacillus sp. ISL-39]MBT2637782.1 signal peptidase I [Bacillus sp. ISL-39]